MAIREIVLYPDAPLTQKAAPVEGFGALLASLVEDLWDSMYEFDGVGLAAPQIGVSQRVLVLHNPEDDRELCLVNPELSECEGNQVGPEGCLSLPHIEAEVPRYERIRVTAFDADGSPLDFVAEGFLARIIQHECDHLDGVVFLDRLDILSREDKYQEWMAVREQLLAAPDGKV